MPYRINCEDKEKFFQILNRYNGMKNLFYSIYATNEYGKFNNVLVDKIFFDFDEADAIEDVKKLTRYCISKGLSFSIFYSGKKGFHFYVHCKPQHLSHPKDALLQAHEFFIGELDLKMDPHIKGDIARVARIPNTYHITGKKFCICIKKEWLEKGLEFIREKASRQQENILYSGELFNLREFDVKKSFSVSDLEIPEFDEEIVFNDKIIDSFPTCIKAWLNDSLHPETGEQMGNYEARYYFAVFCKAKGFTKSLCNEIAKRYFSKAKRKDMYGNNYNHFIRHHVIEYAYRDDVFFPNYQTLLEKGLFVGERPERDDFGLYEE